MRKEDPGPPESTRRAVDYHEHVVVKFRDDVDVRYEDDIGDSLHERGIGAWRDLEKKFPGVRITRLFRSMRPDEIRTLVKKAVDRDPTYRPPNFLTYFLVRCPVDRDAETLAEALSSWRTVERAHVQAPIEPASVVYEDDPQFAFGAQQYLHDAPEGIGSIIQNVSPDQDPDDIYANDQGAWTVPGGAGDVEGLTIVDIERGWKLDHEDLGLTDDALIHGVNHHASSSGSDVWSTQHGTGTLGVIGARDNDVGVLGVTPHLPSESIKVSGAYFEEDEDGQPVVKYNIPDAAMSAIRTLEFGDVLLFEQQTSKLDTANEHSKLCPLEVEPENFDVIRLATALGVVVVEPAGNGIVSSDAEEDGTGFDLDELGSLTHSDGLTPIVEGELNPDDPAFEDSGAILVGASRPVGSFFPPGSGNGDHWRVEFSNYGARVDCFAYGTGVTTTWTSDGESIEELSDSYHGYGGTSSGSAIIAGAALSVQGMAQEELGYRFAPKQLRALLSDPDLGTPSVDPDQDRIGVMPDLWAIAGDAGMNIIPDVYLRDYVGDDGDPHEHTTLWKSPDIFVRPEPADDPQAEFGTGPAVDDQYLGHEVTEGQDLYVYVRVLNRGGEVAEDVTATVYYCEPATLMHGDLWEEVGEVTVTEVPTGDELVVSDPIVWEEDDVPDPGHYCFVGLVGNARDPAPEPADFLTMENYERFVRERNNVAWRNFNVVPTPTGASAGWTSFAFMAPGAYKETLPMELEVGARLPKGSRAALELPRRLFDGIRDPPPNVEAAETDDRIRVPVNPHGRTAIGEAVFPAGSTNRAELLVDVPEESQERASEVFVRQLHEGEEVGRVTWRLVPEKARVRR